MAHNVVEHWRSRCSHAMQFNVCFFVHSPSTAYHIQTRRPTIVIGHTLVKIAIKQCTSSLETSAAARHQRTIINTFRCKQY